MKKLLIILAILIFASTLLYSQIINVPFDKSTIQAGINAAINGDTVLVAEGTYYENINFKGKPITVASQFLLDKDTSHISKTIIDGSKPSEPNKASVVTFDSGEDTTSVLMGFTITGGSGTVSEYLKGGGIFINKSGAHISHNIIKNNTINSTNSRAAGGGICAHFDNPNNELTIIYGNRITNNKVFSTSQFNSYGGGIDIRYANVRIINNDISNNEIGGGGENYGTGLKLSYSNETSIIEGNNISFNTFSNTQTAMGALFLVYTDGVRVLNNIFEGNTGTLGGGLNLGQVKGGTISNNLFKENSAAEGAGIYLNNSNSTIENNMIINNNAQGAGGGISLYNFSNLEIKNNIIANNVAGYVAGGLFLMNNCNPQIINNTIVGNTSDVAGGLFMLEDSNPVLMNTIIYGNAAYTVGKQILFGDTVSNSTIAYCDIEGGKDDFGFDIVGGYYNGTYLNNIDQDPMFEDTLFNLSENSVCVGNGITSMEVNGSTYNCPTTDYFGKSRPNLIDEYADIGAIESEFKQNPFVGIEKTSIELPNEFSLYQNYPNPFNPTTTIEYSIPASLNSSKGEALVKLKIYDILGREIEVLVNEEQKPGYYEVKWDACNQSSGVYFYQLAAGNNIITRKMILLR